MCCGAGGSLLRKEENLKSLESVYLSALLFKQIWFPALDCIAEKLMGMLEPAL